MPKKKSVPKSGSSVEALTKASLIDYLGPIFEELKTDIRRLDSKIVSLDAKTVSLDSKIVSLDSKTVSLDTKIDTVESRLTDKINWQGTLMEQMNKKFDIALELTEVTHSNHMTLKEYGTKIENLERDVKALKAVRAT